MKTVGIIGGLGPETTAEFYLKVVYEVRKQTGQQPLLLISNVGFPVSIENDAIGENKGIGRFVDFLTAEARRLESSGADFLVMPCNSLHVFISEIRESVKIPVVSIVEETCKYIKSKKYQKVGLISTSATVENKVYETAFENEKINFAVPNRLEQAEMNKIIKNLVRGIHLNSDREKILDTINNLKKQNVDAISLACTDLQLLLPSDDNLPIFDTMAILAESTIREITI